MQDLLGSERLFHDRYRVEKKLGEGGMGIVFLAWDVRLERRVAIKALPSLDRPDRIARFAREAKAVARLNHPNIVALYDTDQLGTLPYMVMEYLEGLDLRQVAFPEVVDFLNIVEQVCEALEYAHKEGVVHRDVKPENIILTRSGRVKVLDFGLALFEGAGKVTRTGVIPGTFPYLAPELVTGGKSSPLTDQYALGIVMYELLVGDYPFPTFEIQESLLYRTKKEAYSLSKSRPELPKELCELVNRTIRREPRERFGSISELLDELTSLHTRLDSLGLGLPVAGAGANPDTMDTGALTHPEAIGPQTMEAEVLDPQMAIVRTPASGEATPLHVGNQSKSRPATSAARSTRVWMIMLAIALLAAGIIIGLWLSGRGKSNTDPVERPRKPRPAPTIGTSGDTSSPPPVNRKGGTLTAEQRKKLQAQVQLALAKGDCRKIGPLLPRLYDLSTDSGRSAHSSTMKACTRTLWRLKAKQAFDRRLCDTAKMLMLQVYSGDPANARSKSDAYHKSCLAQPELSKYFPLTKQQLAEMVRRLKLVRSKVHCDAVKLWLSKLENVVLPRDRSVVERAFKGCLATMYSYWAGEAFKRGNCKEVRRLEALSRTLAGRRDAKNNGVLYNSCRNRNKQMNAVPRSSLAAVARLAERQLRLGNCRGAALLFQQAYMANPKYQELLASFEKRCRMFALTLAKQAFERADCPSARSFYYVAHRNDPRRGKKVAEFYRSCRAKHLRRP